MGWGSCPPYFTRAIEPGIGGGIASFCSQPACLCQRCQLDSHSGYLAVQRVCLRYHLLCSLSCYTSCFLHLICVCYQFLCCWAFFAVVSVPGPEPWGGGQTPGPAQGRGACRPSWVPAPPGPSRSVGVTIVFVLAAGDEVLR
jgi:hypothetical protein